MSVNISIRTKKQMNKMDARLVDALHHLLQESVEIPLVYQYLHNPKKEFIIDSDNRIGTVKNITKMENGDIVGDVSIKNILKIASNFNGVIDNMVATVNPKTNSMEIIAFIIYDKHAKEEIVSKNVRRFVDATKLPKSGEIPIMTQYGNDMMKEVSKTLISEYKTMLDKTTK